MYIDIKTLLICNIAIPFFLGLGLLFYKMNHKTYKGYGSWVLSIFLLSLGFFSIMIRNVIPLSLSIVISNFIFVLLVVLRYDGTYSFTRGYRPKKIFYIFPFLTIPYSLFYYYIDESIEMRILFTTTLFIILMIFICIELYKKLDNQNKKLYTASIMVLLLYMLIMIIRGYSWIMYPRTNLLEGETLLFDQLYFLAVTIIEVIVGITWIMINYQRLEAELKATVNNLEKALSEVKTLSGIIPICMHCHEIRDDKGYWNQLDTFLREHSEAEFSHGICPKCLKEKHPKLYEKRKKSKT